MSEQEDKAMAYVIAFTVGPLVIGLVFKWYNYVLFRPMLSYWQWMIIAFAYLILYNCNKKLVGFIMFPVFAASVVGQALSWAGIVTLPLIKL